MLDASSRPHLPQTKAPTLIRAFLFVCVGVRGKTVYTSAEMLLLTQEVVERLAYSAPASGNSFVSRSGAAGEGLLPA